MPLHGPAVQADAAETAAQDSPQDTAQNNALQQDAAPAPEVQLHTPAPKPLPIEAYTISVDQVREHFRAKGVSKSKDTVQRWCRTGALDCHKRGVLGRYFTTEPSLKALEEKLLPDMMAENAGGHSPSATASSDSKPLLAAASTEADSGTQLQAAEDPTAYSEMQAHAPEDAAAPSSTPVDVPVHAADQSDRGDSRGAAAEVQPVTTVPPVAPQPPSDGRLQAEVEGLRAQLKNRDQQIAFLQEEIRSARDQRSAVVQISNRMLETLETMAVGGRLERRAQPDQPPQNSAPQSTDPAPVHTPDRRDGKVY